ncbi:hypothetical protein ERO13_D03G093500v2 [Gossypium hirsutum]|uniref:MLO protein homolog 1 isoform X2 n=2 Tax=Gossypium hirsutum TaxID=3635 RepID=A0A1U8NM34_GOSHI|nr:MLO protein homolog 1 isoform X2 [Gossypium hirsutum]XP_040946006.1 MLO protein homolog 1 isoform X2 [Gossypium hirsutum]KAG4155132.1 hypothetical protein ERO13_D03G093500v2 [Gossypium hirsutum]KAG4155133.1 hypothetical protein ERO13_D03G093500v2 [Gossypium hirsutum]
MAHLAPENETKFDFQKYIKRSLEDDFKVFVGIRSCYHEHIEDVIIRVSMGVIIQFLFSYVTLPLYALVTQMEDFTEKERELRTSSLTRKQPNTGSKETSLDEVLCRHKERKPFAYGLCNECYEEFMKVSRGLDGGSDPPAFQRAEKERLAKLSI